METTVHKYKDAVVWAEKEIITSAWIGKGGISIHLDYLKGLTPEAALKKLQELSERDNFVCSGCAKEITREEIGHQHMAGIYCKKCGEEYRKENSTVCRICGTPWNSCCC